MSGQRQATKCLVAFIVILAVTIAIASVSTFLNGLTHSQVLIGASVFTNEASVENKPFVEFSAADNEPVVTSPYIEYEASVESSDDEEIDDYEADVETVAETTTIINPKPRVEAAVLNQLRSEGLARVIVTFKNPENVDSALIENVIAQVVSDPSQEVVRAKDWFATYIDPEDFDKLAENQLIDRIVEDKPVYTATAESFPLIGQDDAINPSLNGGYNVDGDGYIVCHIDSGIDYGHEVFGSCAPGDVWAGTCDKLLPGSWNFIAGNKNPFDDNGHGTHTGSTIAGDGPTYKGVAPKAKMLVYKVVNDLGIGWMSRLHLAMQYCMDNTTNPSKTIMNIGVAGDVGATAASQCEGDLADQKADAAVAMGITVFAPAGNNEWLDRIPTPACSNSIISSTAIGDGASGVAADAFPVNATDGWGPNRANFVDLAAPGHAVYGARPGNVYSHKVGTSAANAITSGAAVILKEYFEEKYSITLTPAQVRSIFTQTGVMLNDVAAGLVIPRLDLWAAIEYYKPKLNGTPNVTTNEDTTPPSQWIDLWSYTTDGDNTTAQLTFTITSQTNSGLIDCTIALDRYVECGTPALNQFGFSDVTIHVSDGQDTDTDEVRITVIPVNDVPTLSSLPTQNLAYLSGDNQDLVDFKNHAGDVETPVALLSYTINAQTNASVVNCVIDGSQNLDCTTINSNTGTNILTIRVDDGQDYTEEDIVVNVLPNQAPDVTITAPNNDDGYALGNQVTLQCTANDFEDGVLTGGSIEWESDISGYLGIGEIFQTTSLTLGYHTVTVTATDSGSLTDTDTINLLITYCSDSDNGLNFYTFGTASNGTHNLQDQCMERQGIVYNPVSSCSNGVCFLREYHCSAGRLAYTMRQCDCNNGVCLTPDTINIISYNPSGPAATIDEGQFIDFDVSAGTTGGPLQYRWFVDGLMVGNSDSYRYEPDFDDAGIHTVRVVIVNDYDQEDVEWTVTVNDANTAGADVVVENLEQLNDAVAGQITSFRFDLVNVGDTTANDVNWTLDTGESVIISAVLINMPPGHRQTIYTFTKYNTTGAKTVIATEYYGLNNEQIIVNVT